MHLLCFEKSLDLVGYRVVRIITEIRRNFICCCEDGRTCPARDVKDLLVECLLGHLNGVDGTHCSYVLVLVQFPDPTLVDA